MLNEDSRIMSDRVIMLRVHFAHSFQLLWVSLHIAVTRGTVSHFNIYRTPKALTVTAAIGISLFYFEEALERIAEDVKKFDVRRHSIVRNDGGQHSHL